MPLAIHSGSGASDSDGRAASCGRAVDSFRQALRLDPRNVNVLFDLAISYEQVWMLDQAIETWKSLLTIQRQGPWATKRDGG